MRISFYTLIFIMVSCITRRAFFKITENFFRSINTQLIEMQQLIVNISIPKK